MGDVLGVEHPAEFITFEQQVHLDHTSFIDGFIPSTKVLIEQKSLGKDLSTAIRQSDGVSLNPFQQAKRYISELRRLRYISIKDLQIIASLFVSGLNTRFLDFCQDPGVLTCDSHLMNKFVKFEIAQLLL